MEVIRQPRVPSPMTYLSPKPEGKFVPLSAAYISDTNYLWSLPFQPEPVGIAPDVARFQMLSAYNPVGWCIQSTAGTGGTLTVEAAGNSIPYDSDVAAFQVVVSKTDPEFNTIYVLGTDGKLWLETQPKPNLAPTQVDGNVVAFQAIDESHAFVLGGDGNLWLENEPWGFLPPRDRVPVASNVESFQVKDINNVYLLTSSGELALSTSPSWGLGAVIAYPTPWAFEIAPNGVYWITQSGDLYLSSPAAPGELWKTSERIDGNVVAIACSQDDPDGLLVLGSNGNLWYEQPGNVQNRIRVATEVWTHPPLGM